jgi:uncharacterized protein with von Willebrand factor type A (vWA) domain
MGFLKRNQSNRSADPARPLGGVIHSYQRYDPQNIPSPNQPPPDMTGAAFDHMMAFGSTRGLTEEELANAIEIDPSQIQGLGPSIDALIQMLEERKRKILATYETQNALNEAAKHFTQQAQQTTPPKELADKYHKAVKQQQIRDLERLWFKAEKHDERFAKDLLHVAHTLGEKYQVEQLDAEYEFTGRTEMDVPKALEVKEELETIDELLEQLREAQQNAQIGLIDMDKLSEFVEEADIDQLRGLQQQVEDYIREQAEQQGIEQDEQGRYQLTPKAYRLFQSKLLDEIFSDLQASMTGRHEGDVSGEGPVELAKTKDYEFGDSPAHMDIPQSFVNAILREGPQHVHPDHLPSDKPLVNLTADDIEIHETRNNPKCATCVVMDMSGSMRHGGQYINCKRMGFALDGLIRSQYPGDYVQFIEAYSIAKPRHVSELGEMMPKPVTIRDPVVRLKVDMSREDVSESMLPPHFTNIHHGLQLSRRFLSGQDTPNKQIILITDGLPTAHFDGSELYFLYPPDPLTEQATMREALACGQEGITINIFLLPSWDQSSEDVQFAHRMAEGTKGRVLFTGGRDLDRYVLWDYVNHRRKIIG